MDVSVVALRIPDRSAVGEVRRASLKVAADLGLDEEAATRAGIVATELAGNVYKHGGGGWCFVAPADFQGAACVSIIAADRGAGMSDSGLMMSDGYSTAGTPGTGLGAVKRLSLSFDLFSRPGEGVVVAARVGGRPEPGEARPLPAFETGVIVVPKEGQNISGDACAVRRSDAGLQLLVADGLGHGPAAAAAAAAAVAAFDSAPLQDAAEAAMRVHEALRGTRGAAIAIALLAPRLGRVRFAGIGNIGARLVGGTGTQSLVSMNGTAGAAARSVREFEYAAAPGTLLVLHSDGVHSRWSLDDYPGLRLRDPALVAGILFRDHARGRDDAVVLVARLPDSAEEERVA